MDKKITPLLAFFLLFSSVLFSASPAAGEGIKLGFQETLRMADEKNADILSNREAMGQALQRVKQARSYFFPEISADLSESRQTTNLETFGIPPVSASASSVVGPFNVFDARVHLTQTLFDLSMVRRFEGALAGRDVSKATLRKIREDRLALAGTLFLEARRAQSRMEYAKENLKLAALQNRIFDHQLALGTASVTEARHAKAQLSEARYFWRLAAHKASASFSNLKTILGFSVHQILTLRDEEIPKPSLPDAGQIAGQTQKHPEVAVSEALRKQEEAQVSAERASFLPAIQGTADYGANGRTVDGAKETYFYGAKASWSFFDFGRKLARVREAESRARETKVNFDQTLREKESKIYEAKNELKNTVKFLTAKKDQWVYEKNLYEIASKKYQNGSASRLELVAASVSFAKAGDDLEEAKSLYKTAEIGFYHASGQMGKFLEEKNS